MSLLEGVARPPTERLLRLPLLLLLPRPPLPLPLLMLLEEGVLEEPEEDGRLPLLLELEEDGRSPRPLEEDGPRPLLVEQSDQCYAITIVISNYAAMALGHGL